MSAAEIIKQIAALGPDERVRFEQLLRAMQSNSSTPARGANADWPDFGERLREIYGDKIVADSQALIDEGRRAF